MITADSPILSREHTTLDMASRMAKRIVAARAGAYTQTEVTVIVGLYFAFCAQTGVDLVIAVAQLIHETDNLRSWWSQPGRHNPAGIGVTGQTFQSKYRPVGSWEEREPGVWHQGVAFPSWPDAVQAHVGRLMAYAAAADARRQHKMFIDQALGWRKLPANMLGAAPRLGDLTGRWATDVTYATKVSRFANLFLS